MDSYKIRSFFKIINYDQKILENIYILLKKYDQNDRFDIYEKFIKNNPKILSLKDVKSIDIYKEIIDTIKYRVSC